MLNARLAPVLVMMGVTAAMWGCGDDDNPSTGTGGRNTAGTSGKGGSGGKGGSAGKGGGGSGTGGATGGTAGSSAGKGGAGGTTGGTAGSGGTTGGTAGSGGTAGTAGSDVGGQGGEGGDAMGGAGGEGGGSGTLTLEQACAAVCQDQSGLGCYANTCADDCVFAAGDTDAPDEFAALVQCEAAQLGSGDYECYNQPSFPAAPPVPGASYQTPCQTELCAFTCTDTIGYAVENTYIDCGC